MNDIQVLAEVIMKLHGATPEHIGSVPVKEKFGEKTVWDGTVEVFSLTNHPSSSRIYAWTHENDDGNARYVTVLHQHPVVSPETAVRAAIIQEYRNFGPNTEES